MRIGVPVSHLPRLRTERTLDEDDCAVLGVFQGKPRGILRIRGNLAIGHVGCSL